jgi:hypothetical protein
MVDRVGMAGNRQVEQTVAVPAEEPEIMAVAVAQVDLAALARQDQRDLMVPVGW